MDYDSAKLLLLKHGSGTRDSDGNILVAQDGFLQMLRPYRGLNEDSFHNVMQAVYVVADRFHAERYIERDLMKTLWSICNTSRAWGLHPKGMLQRNKLINEMDSALLEEWIDTIECSVEGLLSGCPTYYNVTRYSEYIAAHSAWSNVSFFVPYMVQYLEDESETMDPTAVAIALGCIGASARAALPALRVAAQRTYADWCNDEAQSVIADTISQIESSTEMG